MGYAGVAPSVLPLCLAPITDPGRGFPMSGGVVLTITGDETRDDLRRAIVNLRAKQRSAVIPSTAAEHGKDIDALLEAWPTAQ